MCRHRHPARTIPRRRSAVFSPEFVPDVRRHAVFTSSMIIIITFGMSPFPENMITSTSRSNRKKLSGSSERSKVAVKLSQPCVTFSCKFLLSHALFKCVCLSLRVQAPTDDNTNNRHFLRLAIHRSIHPHMTRCSLLVPTNGQYCRHSWWKSDDTHHTD